MPTGLGIARNILVVRTADVVIAIGGGAGTLSEIAIAWQLGRTVIAIEDSGGWASQLAGKHLDDRRTDPILVAPDPERAIELAWENCAPGWSPP